VDVLAVPRLRAVRRLRAAGTLPRLDDDYYASLLSYSDISARPRYAAALDSRSSSSAIALAGLLLFYGASYLTHPARRCARSTTSRRGATSRGWRCRSATSSAAYDARRAAQVEAA
jgi:hypothetical protein